ncbi:MAG: DUF368 domain-containing protein [Culicoidibacterales bacterium]
MKFKNLLEWKNIYRGMLVGAADLVPGVSGGTIAVLLGIYDELLDSIGNFLSHPVKSIKFLVPLGIGMVTVIVLLSNVIEFLLGNYPQPTNFFFLGLIVGILPYLLRQADHRTNFKVPQYVIVAAATAFVIGLGFFQGEESAQVITELTLSSGVFLFFSGWIASMATLLPGISGSFVLLILGAYTTIISAVSNLNIAILIPVGMGVAVGFIISSKVISYLLKRFPANMYSVIIGLVFGSVFIIFPGFSAGMTQGLLSIVTMLAGFAAATYLGSHDHKDENKI